MVTYAQVRTARPAAWRDAASGWRRLARALAARAEATDRVRRGLAGEWRGAAAVAALAALGAFAAALRAIRGPALACDQALCEHAGEVERIQHRLTALAADPGSALVTVAPDGTVELSRAGVRPDPFDIGVARRTAAEIGGLLLAAVECDERARLRLRAAADGFAAAVLAPPANGATGAIGSVSLPPPSAAPAEVRRWWDGLPPSARAWLLATRPRELGALDGVPVAVRDAANRLVLDQELAAASDPVRRRALTGLSDRLDRAEPARAYLIAFDPAGDGRAVVAVGDPDHARHVLTQVPGAGSGLDDIRGLLGRTDRLATATGGSVSAVLWLGYDAPDGLSAAGTRNARDGADDLDRFQEGLRATAAGAPAHHTVVGHSYGSLVVGLAARDHRLPVDDLVFVGSPGVGVDRAGQLGLLPGHVWASTARFDLIRMAALADRRPEWFDGDVQADRWHGADPGHPRFGGRAFTSDPGSWLDPAGAHSAYFDEGSASLAAIGAIARGDYASVR
jgi:pimeloyl-ACP methyl ester carboxylesterase